MVVFNTSGCCVYQLHAPDYSVSEKRQVVTYWLLLYYVPYPSPTRPLDEVGMRSQYTKNCFFATAKISAICCQE